MKKTLLLAFALILSAATFAQQQLATLNKNGVITVYYGQSALQQAHNAAENGDIITLSPGTFNAENITKAVTIRGAGMLADADAGTAATTLLNDYTITVPNNPNHPEWYLYMEGIYNAGTVKYATAYNPQFFKCYFGTMQPNASSSIMDKASFTNCIIKYFLSREGNSSCAKNPMFINSVILDLNHQNIDNIILKNCVAKFYNNCNSLQNIEIHNSVVYCGDLYTPGGVNAYSSYNSIGIQTNNSNEYYYNYTGLQNHNLYNYKGLSAVFGDHFNGNFYGNFTAGVTFELKDELKETHLGDDGKQIGVYGGPMPFDPKVRNPLIGKVTVAPQSNSAGELQVEIELKNNSQQ